MRIKTHGELLVDNRATGLGSFESAIATCSHCQAAVVMHPLRTRERAVCKKCMAYICDNCTGKDCKPFAMVVDETLEAAARGFPIPVFNPY